MTQQVRLLRLNDDGTAEVVHIRQSACSGDCHKCSGCGAAKETIVLTAHNPLGAQPGDLVVIRSETGPVLAAAAVVYLIPLLLFIAGYLIGLTVWGSGALLGCGAFLAGVAIAVFYDRRVAAKRKTVYTITGYADSELPGS